MAEITLSDIQALAPEILAQQDTQLIADTLSVGRIKLVTTQIGKLTVLGTIGMAAGNALLDTIDSVEDFRHIRYPLANGWLDIADPTARYMLDTICSPADAALLKELAEQADPVDEYTVRKLCWADDGSWLA